MKQSKILISLFLVTALVFGCTEKEEASVEERKETSSQSASQSGNSTNDANAEGQGENDSTLESYSSVEDAAGLSEEEASAVGGNRPPRVLSVAFENPYVHRGVDIQVVPEVVDADYDEVLLQYRWFINDEELIDLDSPTLAGDQFYKGDKIALWVIPSDLDGEGAIFYGTAFEIPNAPPAFVTSPPLDFRATNYAYVAQATDPDDDPLTYFLEEAPEGLLIDNETGQMAWTIGADSVGSHQVKIVAQDIEGARAVQEYTLTLSSEE